MRRIIISVSGTSRLPYGIHLIEALTDIEAKAATGERFVAGALLYNGDHCLSFGTGIYAVPLSALWEEGLFFAPACCRMAPRRNGARSYSR